MGYSATGQNNTTVGQLANLATNSQKPKSTGLAYTPGAPNGVAPIGYDDPNSPNYIDPTKYNVKDTLQRISTGTGGASAGNNKFYTPASALQSLQAQQLNNANQFAAKLPQLQQQTAKQLTTSSNQTMDAQIKQVKNNNNARGLNYSGINQGQQQQVRSMDQQQLANAISGANSGLQSASNTMSAQAVETGVGIQQTQQAIQNQIYQQQMANMQANNQIFGSVVGTGILAASVFSDERLKTNVVLVSKEDLEEMKKHLKAYAFSYKHQEHGAGQWVGVMAQDLERSRLGRTLVFENSNGEKMIDLKKVLSLFLATMAEG